MNRLKYILSAFLASVFKNERLIFFEKILDVPYITEAEVDIDVKIVSHDKFLKIAEKLRTLKINAEENYGWASLVALAEIDGKVVHIRGVMLRKYYSKQIEREIRINSDSACLIGAYTVPEYRGRGVAPKVAEKIFRHLNQLGIEKVYGYIKSDNLPSLRYARKVGYRKIGEVNFIKISKLRWYRFKGETKDDYNTLIRMF